MVGTGIIFFRFAVYSLLAGNLGFYLLKESRLVQRQKMISITACRKNLF